MKKYDPVRFRHGSDRNLYFVKDVYVGPGGDLFARLLGDSRVVFSDDLEIVTQRRKSALDNVFSHADLAAEQC